MIVGSLLVLAGWLAGGKKEVSFAREKGKMLLNVNVIGYGLRIEFMF